MITIVDHPDLTEEFILPSPEWDDSQALQNRVNILRTLDGGYWTYVKKSEVQQLTFNVILTDLDAFATYYHSHSGKFMLLEWKSTYLGAFEPHPLQLSHERRGARPDGAEEIISCTFSFIGVKI